DFAFDCFSASSAFFAASAAAFSAFALASASAFAAFSAAAFASQSLLSISNCSLMVVSFDFLLRVETTLRFSLEALEVFAFALQVGVHTNKQFTLLFLSFSAVHSKLFSPAKFAMSFSFLIESADSEFEVERLKAILFSFPATIVLSLLANFTSAG